MKKAVQTRLSSKARELNISTTDGIDLVSLMRDALYSQTDISAISNESFNKVFGAQSSEGSILKDLLKRVTKGFEAWNKDGKKTVDDYIQYLKKSPKFQKWFQRELREKADFRSENIDMSDIVNNVFFPAIKSAAAEVLSKKNSDPQIKLAGIRWKTAQGFWFEATFAEYFIKEAKKLGIIATHSGSGNRSDDVYFSFENSPGEKTISLTSQDLVKMDDIIMSEILPNARAKTSSETIVYDFDTVYDLMLRKIGRNGATMPEAVFGIQVKNTKLIENMGKQNTNTMAEIKKFNRISNQKGFLDDFRETMKKNEQPSPYEEKKLGIKAYMERIGQAIVYLSEDHRVISTMGRFNVAYADKSQSTGLTWTSDLLKKMIEDRLYLHFQATFTSGHNKDNFGAAVGFRRFLYT